MTASFILFKISVVIKLLQHAHRVANFHLENIHALLSTIFYDCDVNYGFLPKQSHRENIFVHD